MKHLLLIGRVSISLLSIAAILVMVGKNLDVPGYSFANFFSYYTIQSNLIVIATLGVLVVLSVRPKMPDWADRLRGATTLYIVITGIIYHLLLRSVDVQLQTDWINLALHTIAPLYMLIDWLVQPPRHTIALRRAFIWLAYPFVYGVYSLIRGHITGWYPYPFLNAGKYGYMQIVLNSLLIATGFFLLAAATVSMPAWVRTWKRADTGKPKK